MSAVKAGDVDRVLRGPLPGGIAVLLIYGTDLGRVSERAKLVAEDPSRAGDPFAVTKIDGAALADEPGRLVEEATSGGLFAARRTIWVKPTSRNIATAVAACLDGPAGDSLIVIEAGDLAKSAPLRQLCEKSPRALALPSYPDEARDLRQVLDETLRQEGLTIEPEARATLLDNLGGDRLATRGELAKLCLYVRGRRTITLEDVREAVSDVSAMRLDDAIDAAFLGDAAELSGSLAQLAQQGIAAQAVVSGALRHALTLMTSRTVLDETGDLDRAIKSWRGLHFRREPAVKRQIGRWPVASSGRAIVLLDKTMLDTRRMPGLADALVSRALFALADKRLADRGFAASAQRHAE